MKILHVENSDFDGYGDWLSKEVSEKFVNEGFTHIENEGSICKCGEMNGNGEISVGEEECYIEEFDGFYCHYDKFLEVISQAWPENESPGYGNDPLELIATLINERDELKKNVAAMRLMTHFFLTL